MNGYSPKLPLARDSMDGFFSLNKTALETIKQDFKMLVLTNPGERVMLPNYGVGIRALLFEQNTGDLNLKIRNKITEQVKKYMSFLELLEINIEADTRSENALNVSIVYRVPTSNLNQTLFITLSN